MNIKILKTLFFVLFFTLALVFANNSFAAGLNVNSPVTEDSLKGMANQNAAFEGSSGFAPANSNSVTVIIAGIIKTVLSVLGILFVVIIIISGFKWMNAGGNEKTVDEAQSRIKNAIIGLIIVLSAYGITAFVFKNISSSASSGTPSAIKAK